MSILHIHMLRTAAHRMQSAVSYMHAMCAHPRQQSWTVVRSDMNSVQTIEFDTI